MSDWQPIATASKDEDLLLLYLDGSGVRAGYWDDEAAPAPSLPPVLIPIDERPTLTPIVPACPEYKVLSDTEAWARMKQPAQP